MESGRGKRIENPFALKVGQVFTGFGVGCGVGIGVGRPLNLGAIPMIDQVMRATSGATAAFSGIGQQTNKFMRKLGLKSIEAGVGCGVGFGHGFGAGVALKPGAAQNIQASLMRGLMIIMQKLKITPDLSFAGKFALPESVSSSMRIASETAGKALQDPMGSSMQLASQTAGKALQDPLGSSVQLASQTAEKVSHNPLGKSMKKASQTATGAFATNTPDTVIGNFLQGTAPQVTNKMRSNEEVGGLQSENQILQM
ncbi:hypothetical protein KI387_024832, partial [Taxus chinensis]